MYTDLINFNKDNSLLVISKMNAALYGHEPCISEATDLNALIKSYLAEFPEKSETMLISTAQVMFNLFMCDQPKELDDENKAKFKTIVDIVQENLPPLDFEWMWAISCRFKNEKLGFLEKCTIEETYNFSENANTINEIYGYIVKRDLLNRILNSSAFVENTEISKKLVHELENYPEDVKADATLIGNDIFLYRKKERGAK